MKPASKTNIVIAWFRETEDSDDCLTAVHSRELTSQEQDEAYDRRNDLKATGGPVPMLFLDPALDTPELRKLIQAIARHRLQI
jgi:hypothetical protein